MNWKIINTQNDNSHIYLTVVCNCDLISKRQYIDYGLSMAIAWGHGEEAGPSAAILRETRFGVFGLLQPANVDLVCPIVDLRATSNLPSSSLILLTINHRLSNCSPLQHVCYQYNAHHSGHILFFIFKLTFFFYLLSFSFFLDNDLFWVTKHVTIDFNVSASFMLKNIG